MNEQKPDDKLIERAEQEPAETPEGNNTEGDCTLTELLQAHRRSTADQMPAPGFGGRRRDDW
jgi:hypothetical protein